MKENCGLSILIPAYNHDCTAMVKTLCLQVEEVMAEDSNVGFEIIVADDGSSDADAKRANREIAGLQHCTYTEQPHNVGRAVIRNKLAVMASYSHLLVLDCDVVISRHDFIKRYVCHMHDADVVIGNLHFNNPDGRFDNNLRYIYEKDFLKRNPTTVRMRNPYASFRTTNFMARKDVMLAHPFDETFTEYGYEDALFGKGLKEAGVTIIHIDNHVTIDDIESNDVFMEKTRQSLRTLSAHAKDMEGYSKILDLYTKVGRWHLLPLVKLLFSATENMLYRMCTGNHPSLLCYALYKFGFFTSVHTRQ